MDPTAEDAPARTPGLGRSAVVVALAVALLLVSLIALAARTTGESPVTGVPDFSRNATPPTQSQAPPPQVSLGPPPIPGGEQQPPSPAMKFLAQVIVALAVIAGVALVGAVIFLLARTLARRQAPTGIEDATGEVVVDLVAMEQHLDRSAGELDVSGDVNIAIVRCWEGLEALASESGTVRDPAQTAREFTLSVLAGAELPPGPMGRLADLYEAALFSGDRLPERARDNAVRCLQELRKAVAEAVPS